MFNFTQLYKMNTSHFNNFFVNSLKEVIGQWETMFDEYEQHPTREGFEAVTAGFDMLVTMIRYVPYEIRKEQYYDVAINAFNRKLKPYRAVKEEADRQSLIEAMKATPGIGVFTK